MSTSKLRDVHPMDTSYLVTQVTTIIGQLHGLFDEIGVPAHERESRESELFAALSEALHGHLRQVTTEKNALTEEAHRIIKTIRQMEASLDDNKPTDDYSLEDEHLKVTTPLNRCIQSLKEKHNTVVKIHRERFDQVKKLVVALESYSSHLEPSFLKVKLPPTSDGAKIAPTFDLSPSYVMSLDTEFTRVYEEYERRLATIKSTAEEVVNMYAELGIPQAQTDSAICKHYRESPEQLGLHLPDINRLQQKRDKLLEEKRNRERKLKEMKTAVESLWDRLGVDDMDRKRFLAGTRGCGMRAINEFEAELNRLNELKRQNLGLFVEDARFKLQELWDVLYFSEEEMLDFTPAFSDVYSDALLSAHEDEIARLESLKQQRLPILQAVEKHRSLVNDREDLAASSQDASRLMKQKGEKRDPGKLLREEKMRKRITKELPKVEADLRKTLERWEDEYGRPFLVHGQRYLDELEVAAAKPPPPSRSKTPNALIPTSSTKTQTIPVKFTPTSSKPGTVKAAPRSGAKTPIAGNRREAPTTASATPGARAAVIPGARSGTLKSPSKIPARVPLGSMKNGNNSPERKQPLPPVASNYDSNTIRKMGPPRAPPPKMRDLFPRPAPVPAVSMPPTPAMEDDENWRSTSVASSSNSGSVIRHRSPEDVYDGREHMSYAPPTYPSGQPYPNAPANHVPYAVYPSQSQYSQPPQHPYQSYSQHSYTHSSAAPSSYASSSVDTRAPSQSSSIAQSTSTAPTGVGSENWETFEDDVSDEGLSEAGLGRYGTVKASAGQKRYAPQTGGYSPRPVSGKRLKAVYAGGEECYVDDQGRVVSASSWTDEGF